jgi:hypothetical protein
MLHDERHLHSSLTVTVDLLLMMIPEDSGLRSYSLAVSLQANYADRATAMADEAVANF